MFAIWYVLGSKKRDLAVAALAIISLRSVHAETAATVAIRTGHWTKAEEVEFRSCVSRMTPTQKSGDPGTPESWCEVWEERMHWLHLHPDLRNRKQDSARWRQCNHSHAAEMSGTPQQFWEATDICLCEAYGIKRK